MRRINKRWLVAIGVAIAVVGLIWVVSHNSSVQAVTTLLVPDGDVNNTFALQSSTTADCPVGGGVNHCSAVNEGATSNDADYVNTGTLGSTGEVEEYSLTSAASIETATQVVVKVRARSITLGSAADSLGISLRVNGALLAQTNVTLSTSITDYTVTFNGTWSQTDVDSMRIYTTRIAGGTGSASSKDDDVAIYNANATLTYTQAVSFTQSAYRWFNNTDAAAKLTFLKTYAPIGDEDIAMLNDGSIITTGSSSTLIVNKLDQAGNYIWAKTFGTVAGATIGHAVTRTADGGFAITGETSEYGAGNKDVFLAKFTVDGTLTWTKTWGGATDDIGYDVVQSQDGGYIVGGATQTGSTDYNVALIKFDGSGASSWSKSIGTINSPTSGESDLGHGVAELADGSIAVTGESGSFTGSFSRQFFVSKFSSTGTHIWSRVISASLYGKQVIATSDGGIAATGLSSTGSGWSRLSLVKYDSSGNLEWMNEWGNGTGAVGDRGQDLVQTSDGGYVVSGGSESYGVGGEDAALVRFTSAGAEVWSKTWGTAGNEVSSSLAQDQAGGLYSLATSTTDALIKYDDLGAVSGCSTTICKNINAASSIVAVTPLVGNPSVITPTVTVATPTVSGPVDATVSTTVSVAASPTVNVGTALATLNTAASVSSNTPFRLRLATHIASVNADAGLHFFKIQSALRGADGVCDTSFTNETYADISRTTGSLRFYDNALASDGGPLATNANDPAHGSDTLIRQSYEEANDIALPTTTATAQDALWDFPLVFSSGATPGSYCVRIVKTSNSLLTSYAVIPEIVLAGGVTGPTLDQQMRGGQAVVNGAKAPFSW